MKMRRIFKYVSNNSKAKGVAIVKQKNINDNLKQ